MPTQTVVYSNGVITITKRNGSQVQMAFDGDSLEAVGGEAVLIGARCNFSMQNIVTDVGAIATLISPANFPNDPAQFDTGGFRDAAHPSRLVAPSDGVYLVGFAVVGLTVPIDFGNVTLITNGGAKSEALNVELVTEPTSDFLSLNSVPMSGHAVMKLRAGDYIEFTVNYHGHDFGGGPSSPAGLDGSMWMIRSDS